MEKLITKDINGNTCHFQYLVLEKDILRPKEITFRVYSNPIDEMRWFDYTFKITDKDTAKGIMMTANSNPEFQKKGIPERIIEKAGSHLRGFVV